MAHLIDSHCHLTSEPLSSQIEAVLARAEAAGVGEFITVAEDLDDARQAIALAGRFRSIRVAAGVHPHRAAQAPAGWDDELRRTVGAPEVRAIGETGLDHHYNFSDRSSQQRVFRRHLELAEELDKPVVIHSREAQADVLAALDEHPRLRGVVFHCFSGTRAEAEQILQRGYWLSLTGVVTFKRSDELRAVARTMPMDRLMVETDAPFLSPEPVRNVRLNEPAFMVHTARCVAEQRGMGWDEFVARTAENTRRFFSLEPEGQA